MRGHRIPNFDLPAQDDRRLLLYELAHGVPLLIGACGADWSPDDSVRFAEAVHSGARERGLQSVVLVGEGVDLGHPPPEGSATAVDREGAVRTRVFGPLPPEEGAVQVADPNLRVVDGAVIERSALAGSALEQGLDELVESCLGELERERASGPPVAPVLVVPRVLSPEICGALVEGFRSWEVVPSPMPTGSGELAPDPARKSRLDAFIGDPRLEQELMRGVAQRVLPELEKAFWYRATHFERVKLVCYRATEGGHFAAHRDNTAPSTAHRRFALTLNLNTGSYAGGELEFPEYGRDCAYDVPAGSALLFSCTHAHRVRPVSRGERYALVSFAFARAESEAPPPSPT